MNSAPESPGSEGDDNEIHVDPSVTPELFREWRSPRFGKTNPERLSNPVWEWQVRTKINAYRATELLKGPSPFEAGPGWCFDRHGQSSTKLPDGRVVLIAGEHEDHYDPDFHIYNDVVVLKPDGSMDIFVYPKDVFPLTDFHTATLAGNRIIIAGNLGYPESRIAGQIQVLALDLKTMAIAPVRTTGEGPGWIHDHTAKLSDDGFSLLVEKGLVEAVGAPGELEENIDEWKLHLETNRWERITTRSWPTWVLQRQDGAMNHLWEYYMEKTSMQFPGLLDNTREHYRKLNVAIPTLEESIGQRPDFNLYDKLYDPAIAHEKIPSTNDASHLVHRIKIQGVQVRYVEDMNSIRLVIEGELSPATQEALLHDLRDKLTRLENAPWRVKQILYR